MAKRWPLRQFGTTTKPKSLRASSLFAVENQVFDWRDSLMILTLLYHSAIKIGADAPDLFRRVAAISTSQTADSYLQCLACTPEQRDIVKFGFKEGTDLDGNFTYVAK
jgi:hypothetical protein